MERFRMELESLSKNEEFARVVVTVFISRLDPTLEEIDDVKTAVSEAVTNAEIHGYGGESGTITVEVEIEGREVTVVVEDYGIGIRDVEKAMEPMFTTEIRHGILLYGGVHGSGACGIGTWQRDKGCHEKTNRQVIAWMRQWI